MELKPTGAVFQIDNLTNRDDLKKGEYFIFSKAYQDADHKNILDYSYISGDLKESGEILRIKSDRYISTGETAYSNNKLLITTDGITIVDWKTREIRTYELSVDHNRYPHSGCSIAGTEGNNLPSLYLLCSYVEDKQWPYGAGHNIYVTYSIAEEKILRSIPLPDGFTISQWINPDRLLLVRNSGGLEEINDYGLMDLSDNTLMYFGGGFTIDYLSQDETWAIIELTHAGYQTLTPKILVPDNHPSFLDLVSFPCLAREHPTLSGECSPMNVGAPWDTSSTQVLYLDIRDDSTVYVVGTCGIADNVITEVWSYNWTSKISKAMLRWNKYYGQAEWNRQAGGFFISIDAAQQPLVFVYLDGKTVTLPIYGSWYIGKFIIE